MSGWWFTNTLGYKYNFNRSTSLVVSGTWNATAGYFDRNSLNANGTQGISLTVAVPFKAMERLIVTPFAGTVWLGNGRYGCQSSRRLRTVPMENAFQGVPQFHFHCRGGRSLFLLKTHPYVISSGLRRPIRNAGARHLPPFPCPCPPSSIPIPCRNQVAALGDAFAIAGEFIHCDTINSGHINLTFRATYRREAAPRTATFSRG